MGRSGRPIRVGRMGRMGRVGRSIRSNRVGRSSCTRRSELRAIKRATLAKYYLATEDGCIVCNLSFS